MTLTRQYLLLAGHIQTVRHRRGVKLLGSESELFDAFLEKQIRVLGELDAEEVTFDSLKQMSIVDNVV